MRILLGHNFYRQPGGEDYAFRSEVELLRSRGHEVMTLEDDNRRIDRLSPIEVSISASWSRRSYRRVLEAIDEFQPNIAHFHNTFPLLSPSVFYACKTAGVPVVKTLHNYRLMCPAGTFFRDGQVCEDCTRWPLPGPGVVHSCYQASRVNSGVVASAISIHRALRTWHKKVDRLIATSDFARDKFLDGGLPPAKISVKPNFVLPDPGGRTGVGDFVLYAGRLSSEKGIDALVRSWRGLGDIRLVVAGTGPLEGMLKNSIKKGDSKAIDYMGYVDRTRVMSLMQRARVLLFPSVCYENFPMAIVEAFAAGLPVIFSRLGAAVTMVSEGETGLGFTPGDPLEIQRAVRWACEHTAEIEIMGRRARQEYEEKYTASRNYELLIDIYSKAIKLNT